MNALLDKAINVAVRAHGGQVDKGGYPYILHALRVGAAGRNIEEQIVGMLHDVVEDTTFPVELLREFFGDYLTDAVLSVSRAWVAPGPIYVYRAVHIPYPIDAPHSGWRRETYREYIARAKSNSLGRAVKINDLLDNLQPDRLRQLPVHDWAGMKRRYTAALAYMRDELPEPGTTFLAKLAD